ncbi:MAG: DUF4956 domain-containing protein [Vallitaleaceae bacterium]|nr:DUF4956 domain-containing protein [Vallitaleaceae bacterium]
MFESILTSQTTSNTISLGDVFITIIIAFIVGMIISTTYMKSHHKETYSENFSLTMVLLPAVIAILIMLIGSDVARAFSLAGAFSIIRFRSNPGEPKDIAYVLFAMAAGLAVGIGVYLYAVVFTVILCMIMYGISQTPYGKKKTQSKELRITVPEDLDYEEVFEDVMKRYTQSYRLTQVKTAALGSLFQLSYLVELNHETHSKAFLDELRTRNGNLNIALSLVTESKES